LFLIVIFAGKRKIMKKYLIIAIIILLAAMGVMYNQLKKTEEKWKVSEGNVKAYASMFDSSRKQNVALQLTVDQLGYFKDSVLQELDETRKKLKIRDKDLKTLQQVKSSFSKADTITVTQVDTLFREPSLAMDTVMGDEWYTLRLGLHYPSMIAVNPEFKSKKNIVVSSKKETVNPPKKFFLFRWLQKKHRVVHIDVEEKNPYVSGETTRYVEIIK
jgi:hypothetical protein